MILVDPVLFLSSDSGDQPSSLAVGTGVRRGIWADHTRAVQYAAAGRTLQNLDPRVVDHYVVCPLVHACGAPSTDSYQEQAMYGLPTERRPDKWGVAPNFPQDYETMYAGAWGKFVTVSRVPQTGPMVRRPRMNM